MQLLQMYDGHAVVAIHWTELRVLVEALEGHDSSQVSDLAHGDTLAVAFEAMMYAGKLQVAVGDVTLRQFRAEQGLRDWQPHLVFDDVDDAANDDVA